MVNNRPSAGFPLQLPAIELAASERVLWTLHLAAITDFVWRGETWLIP